LLRTSLSSSPAGLDACSTWGACKTSAAVCPENRSKSAWGRDCATWGTLPARASRSKGMLPATTDTRSPAREAKSSGAGFPHGCRCARPGSRRAAEEQARGASESAPSPGTMSAWPVSTRRMASTWSATATKRREIARAQGHLPQHLGGEPRGPPIGAQVCTAAAGWPERRRRWTGAPRRRPRRTPWPRPTALPPGRSKARPLRGSSRKGRRGVRHGVSCGRGPSPGHA
jgi:hypothetical protein